MADGWNFCDTFLSPCTKSTFFYFSKSWFVAELQGFKVTPLLHVKLKVPIVRPGHFHTFCWRQMIEIFVVYPKRPKTKNTFFLFFKILIRCWDTRVQSYLKAQWQKPIFQELISRVAFEIETRGQVFCIALGPATICIATGTIGLLHLFYNTGWHFERLKSCPA